MVVRPAKPEDIPILRAIAARSETAAHWTEQQYASAIAGTPPRRLVLVAESDSIEGFAVGVEIASEWELENIVVEQKSRGKGIGSKLLATFLDQLRTEGARKVFLEVRESNRAARRLYEKWGFEVAGRRIGYYHSPTEDAILYRKIVEIQLPKFVDRACSEV